LKSLSLAPAADNPVPKSVPCPLEGDPDAATSCADTGSDSNTKTTSISSVVTATTTTASATTTRLAVLADLLTDLPSPQRREVIASLPAEDRATIARMLIDV
jgi:hypothetical protein